MASCCSTTPTMMFTSSPALWLGLKEDICVAIALHRSKDVDTAGAGFASGGVEQGQIEDLW